jgi:hypothetical protein
VRTVSIRTRTGLSDSRPLQHHPELPVRAPACPRSRRHQSDTCAKPRQHRRGGGWRLRMLAVAGCAPRSPAAATAASRCCRCHRGCHCSHHCPVPSVCRLQIVEVGPFSGEDQVTVLVHAAVERVFHRLDHVRCPPLAVRILRPRENPSVTTNVPYSEPGL